MADPSHSSLGRLWLEKHKKHAPIRTDNLRRAWGKRFLFVPPLCQTAIPLAIASQASRAVACLRSPAGACGGQSDQTTGKNGVGLADFLSQPSLVESLSVSRLVRRWSITPRSKTGSEAAFWGSRSAMPWAGFLKGKVPI